MKDMMKDKPKYLTDDQWIHWLKYRTINVVVFKGRKFEDENETAIREARIAARAQAIYEDFLI